MKQLQYTIVRIVENRGNLENCTESGKIKISQVL